MTEHDPLYEALVKLEDAANTVGSLTICWQGSYRQLTDSLSSGHGEAEARTRFELETALLADAHTCWAGAAAVLNAQIADGAAWQAWFMAPRKRCANCGEAETWLNRWTHDGTCNECFANGQERAEHSETMTFERRSAFSADAVDELRKISNPFAETDRQRYGERGVIATEDI